MQVSPQVRRIHLYKANLGKGFFADVFCCARRGLETAYLSFSEDGDYSAYNDPTDISLHSVFHFNRGRYPPLVNLHESTRPIPSQATTIAAVTSALASWFGAQGPVVSGDELDCICKPCISIMIVILLASELSVPGCSGWPQKTASKKPAPKRFRLLHLLLPSPKRLGLAYRGLSRSPRKRHQVHLRTVSWFQSACRRRSS